MFLKIIKILLRLLGNFWLAKTMKVKLHEPMSTIQDFFIKKTKHIGWSLLWICLICKLLSSSVHFLLLGLSHGINQIYNSNCIGFFISSMGCFLITVVLVWLFMVKKSR